MSGLSAFGIGLARGFEDKRVRQMENEDRDFLKQDRQMRIEDRQADQQFRTEQRQWQTEDRAVAEQERARAEQERTQAEAALGRPMAVFQAEMLKMRADVEKADAEWQKKNGGKLRDMEMQRSEVGLSNARAQAGELAYSSSRRREIDGRVDEEYERAQTERAEAEERERIAQIGRREDGTLDPEVVLGEYSKSQVLDPGSSVQLVKQLPNGKLVVQSDPDEDGDAEVKIIPADQVQDFLAGIVDPKHWDRVQQQRAQMELQEQRFAQAEYGKNARAGLTATASPEKALEFAESLAPSPIPGQGAVDEEGAPYPDGTELTGPDGRLYVVRNGEPVPK